MRVDLLRCGYQVGSDLDRVRIALDGFRLRTRPVPAPPVLVPSPPPPPKAVVRPVTTPLRWQPRPAQGDYLAVYVSEDHLIHAALTGPGQYRSRCQRAVLAWLTVPFVDTELDRCPRCESLIGVE